MEQSLEALNDVDSLANFISEKQKELSAEIKNREVVDNQKFELQLKILSLQRSIKDNQIELNTINKSLNKAKVVCMTLALEVKRATQKFWSIKNP